jgi:hypothetical protein
LSDFVEEDALLALTPVLFEREDTIAASYRMKSWRTAHRMVGMSEEEVKEIWALRIDIQTRLFAEAFEITPRQVTERTRKALQR